MSAMDELRAIRNAFADFNEADHLFHALAHDYERYLMYVRQTKSFIQERIETHPQHRAQWLPQLAIAEQDEETVIKRIATFKQLLAESGTGPKKPS